MLSIHRCTFLYNVAIIFLIVVCNLGGEGGILHAEIDDASSGESDEILFREFLPSIDPLSRYQRFMQIISSKVYHPSDTDDRLSIRWLVRSNRERMDSFLVNPWEENLLAYIIDSQKRRTGSGRWRSRSRYESRNESEDIVVWKIREKGARNIWRFLSSIMHIASIFIVCSKPETYVCSTSFQGKLDAFILKYIVKDIILNKMQNSFVHFSNRGHRKFLERFKLVNPIMSEKKKKTMRNY